MMQKECCVDGATEKGGVEGRALRAGFRYASASSQSARKKWTIHLLQNRTTLFVANS